MHWWATIFGAFWMTCATLGAIFSGLLGLLRGQPAGLIAFALPLAGGAFFGLPFALEAKKAEGLLREVFAAAPAPPAEGGPYR
jgi:hypothetical protein